jgi:hypothetical protein
VLLRGTTSIHGLTTAATLWLVAAMGMVIWPRDAAYSYKAMPNPIPNLPTSLSARSALRGHGLMHGREKGVVVKRFNEIGNRSGLYRRVPHRIVVVCGTYDDARLGRNDLELLLDFKAAHIRHPDINDHESHRIADNVREKTERLTEQLRLQAYGREQAIERFEHRWVVIDEADYSVGGRQDSR